MSGNALINLGELSKPATVLIEKVSAAVGGIARPYQIVRVAKAEAEAEKIRAEAQIEITDLHIRAFQRFLNEEAQRQTNMETITRRAIPLLAEDSSPDKMDDDWVVNFFSKCRIVSKDEMQILWAKVLAGEANSPGAFSKKTVNLMADLDSTDAELFTSLCGFVWIMINEVVPLIFDPQEEIYNRSGINFSSLLHLESLSLIKLGVTDYARIDLPKRAEVFYYGRTVELVMPKEADNRLRLGKVLLTKAGQELAPVCGSKPVEGFFEYVYARWVDQGVVPKTAAPQDPEPANKRTNE